MNLPAPDTPQGGKRLTVRCYGGSMDFFFASGDLLSVDTGVKADPGSIKPGDIIAYLDWADAPLVSVHRVIIPFHSPGGLRFLTKGDGNLWFDPPVSADQLVGKVTGVSRGGKNFHIGSGTGRAAGLRIAAYSYFAALVSLACRAAAVTAQYPLCMAASAAAALAPSIPPSASLLKGLLRVILLADTVRREALRSPLARLAARIAALESAPAGEQPAATCEAGETVLAGEIRGKVRLAGRVLVAGDVTILPGASLTLAQGAEVRFSRAKYGNASALRPDGILPTDFSDGRLCKFLVYGELVCGGEGAPVRLGDGAAQWDSIIFLGRSRGVIRNTEFLGRSRPLRAMDFSRLTVESAVSCGGAAPAFLALSGFAGAGLSGSDFRDLAAPVSVKGISRFTARNCRFSGTAAAVSAGGLSVSRLYRCAFSGFTAEAFRLYGAARAALSGCSASGGASFCSCSGKSSLAIRGCGLSGLSGTAALFYGRSLVIRGCRVTGGARGVFFSGRSLKALSSEFSRNSAAALEAVSGSAVWRNCRFETNLGPAAVFAGRSLTMGSCRFLGNAQGLVFSGERLRAVSSEFAGNSATALEAVSGRVSLEDCRFEANSGVTALAFSGLRLDALRCAALANKAGFDITRGDAAVSDSDFSRNSGAALAFSGGRLDALRCGTDGNGEGFVISGRDCAVSDSSFLGNAGAALVFSGRKLDALRCRAENNGRGFLCSGEEAAVSVSSFASNAAASLETDRGVLLAEECSFAGGPEALRAGRGARAALRSSRVEGARECGVTASGPGTAVSLSGVMIERCWRGVHASGGGVSASGSSVLDSSERGLYAEKGGALDWNGGEISRNVAQGVRLESGSRLRLRETALTGNADGISSEGSSVTMSGAVLSGHSGSAISLTGGEHELADCVLENSGSGLGVYGGAYCSAQGLAVSGTGAEAVDLSSGRLRVSCLSVKNCPGGIKAGAGGVLEAEVLELDGAASHGIQLREGARLLAKGGKISSCGACAVFSSGPCASQIDSFEISGCRDGITSDGGGTVVRATSIEDIAGACLSCSGGRLEADGLRLRRARTGLALHKGSSSAVSCSEISDMEAGLEATGGSVCSLSGTSLRTCARGAWLQDGARAELSACFVENSSEAGIYADSAVMSAEKTSFGNNNMAIFADRGSEVTIKDCGFSGNRTGIKADNSSGVNASDSTLSGCEWDAVWCAGGARLELRGNTFSSNRYCIKEDGPCSVDSAGNSFSGSGEGDHLAWPRV